MRRASQSLHVLGLLAVVAACQKDASPIRTTSQSGTQDSPAAQAVDNRGHSLVRVVNAASDGKTVDVELGSRTFFPGIASGGVTDYQEVDDHLARFSVVATAAKAGTVALRVDEMLSDGLRYTAFVITEDVSKRGLRVVQDDVIPDSGKARLRVIHAAPGGPEFDVRSVTSADKLFAGVNFSTEAGYLDLEPALMAFELRAAGKEPVLLRIPTMQLRPGTATTIVITGAGKLGYFVFTDAMLKQVAER